jgi:hypothetical protein
MAFTLDGAIGAEAIAAMSKQTGPREEDEEEKERAGRRTAVSNKNKRKGGRVIPMTIKPAFKINRNQRRKFNNK